MNHFKFYCWRNKVFSLLVLFMATLLATKTSHGQIEALSWQIPESWEYSAPLIAPEQRDKERSHAQKDPSVVFFDGKWHVFMTVKLKGRTAIEYCSFGHWDEANSAERTILRVSGSHYYGAPQVFYFRPHGKWYLIYQVGVPDTEKMWVAYSTTTDIASPGSWTEAIPILDGGASDPREVGGIDYWIICDDQRAYLFFTSLNGKMWRLWTALEDFPLGFHDCELALEAEIFEASHTYKLKGMDQYLTIVEQDGQRYYKAFTADRLDGGWTPVAHTAERPFAGWNNVHPASGVPPWTDNISHGELVRDGYDERLTVDPHAMQFLFQGMLEKDKAGKPYREYRWRIGLLTPVVDASSVKHERTISKAELTDKIHGYWIGQLAGNYLGFPFENLYADRPIPVFVDRYYNYGDADSLGLKMNTGDRRAYVQIMADAMGGAWSDDDTDIEFVTLHAIEKYGLDLNYKEIAATRKEHVRRFIWSSNARVRDLIDQGYIPPETGSRELNEYWYRISSQLINEIWGVVYPGMTDKAAERAEWGARITNDGWATHGTRVIVTMYSAAFFEKDPRKLLEIGLSKLPGDSPYLEAFNDLLKWSGENEDWRVTRQLIHDKYFREVDGFTIPYPMGGAVINGLSGIMALLYGNGDFTRTVGIATTSGYDCDNQAATMGGLIGVINGGNAIPDRFTRELPSRGSWETPFNDTYINYSRDKLPNFNRISDIVERLVAIAEQAILENGGSISRENGEVIYRVRTDF